MKIKVSVTIADKEYTMVASENEQHVRRCAALVDTKIRETAGGRLSQVDAAVLAAMNIADLYYQSQDDAESLRRKLKESADEYGRLQKELSEKERQILKLQQGKK